MNYSAIIPAGGTSSRYGARNKLLEPLNGNPLFLHAVMQFRKFCPDSSIVLPVHQSVMGQIKELLEEFCPGNSIVVVQGGIDRTRSVLNAMEALPRTVKLTAVHDAARPLIQAATIEKVYLAAEKYSAAAAARPATNTLKMIDSNGLLTAGNVKREQIWEIETPQTFRTELLLHALRKTVSGNLSFTDDTAAVETFCGICAHPVIPDEINLKVTHFSDLALAEALLRAR